jgi:hypothetical protein
VRLMVGLIRKQLLKVPLLEQTSLNTSTKPGNFIQPRGTASFYFCFSLLLSNSGLFGCSRSGGIYVCHNFVNSRRMRRSGSQIKAENGKADDL